MIKAQRVQYNEFVESELKTRFQWIGQCSQWVKNEGAHYKGIIKKPVGKRL